VIKADFEAVGIGSAKIKGVLDLLENKRVIIIENCFDGLKITINKNVDLWTVKQNGSKEKLVKLVGKNLSKQKHNTCQNGNNKLAKTESQKLDKAFNFTKKQCSKEKDKEILKKNNKEEIKTDYKEIDGFEKMKKDLVEKKGFNI